MTLERNIEAHLVKRVKALGGAAYKFKSTTAGVADRIVLLPGGVVWFVELKSEKGQLSPMQKVFMHEMLRLGQRYVVLNSKESVDDFIRISL